MILVTDSSTALVNLPGFVPMLKWKDEDVFSSHAVGNPGVLLHSLSGPTPLYPYRRMLLLMFNPRADEVQGQSGVMLAVVI